MVRTLILTPINHLWHFKQKPQVTNCHITCQFSLSVNHLSKVMKGWEKKEITAACFESCVLLLQCSCSLLFFFAHPSLLTSDWQTSVVHSSNLTSNWQLELQNWNLWAKITPWSLLTRPFWGKHFLRGQLQPPSHIARLHLTTKVKDRFSN